MEKKNLGAALASAEALLEQAIEANEYNGVQALSLLKAAEQEVRRFRNKEAVVEFLQKSNRYREEFEKRVKVDARSIHIILKMLETVLVRLEKLEEALFENKEEVQHKLNEISLLQKVNPEQIKASWQPFFRRAITLVMQRFKFMSVQFRQTVAATAIDLAKSAATGEVDEANTEKAPKQATKNVALWCNLPADDMSAFVNSMIVQKYTQKTLTTIRSSYAKRLRKQFHEITGIAEIHFPEIAPNSTEGKALSKKNKKNKQKKLETLLRDWPGLRDKAVEETDAHKIICSALSAIHAEPKHKLAPPTRSDYVFAHLVWHFWWDGKCLSSEGNQEEYRESYKNFSFEWARDAGEPMVLGLATAEIREDEQRTEPTNQTLLASESADEDEMDTSSEPLTTPPNLAAQQKEKQVVQPREETSDDDDGDDDGDAEDQSRDGDRNGDRNGESKTLKPAKRANVSQNDKIAISRSVAQAARFLASQTNTTTKNNAVSKKRKRR